MSNLTYDIYSNGVLSEYRLDIGKDIPVGDSLKVKGVLMHHGFVVEYIFRNTVSDVLDYMDSYLRLKCYDSPIHLKFRERPRGGEKIQIVFDNTVIEWLSK